MFYTGVKLTGWEIRSFATWWVRNFIGLRIEYEYSPLHSSLSAGKMVPLATPLRAALSRLGHVQSPSGASSTRRSMPGSNRTGNVRGRAHPCVTTPCTGDDESLTPI